MLILRDLPYRIAGRVLRDHVSATIPAGHKVGLVGRNGTGKSTLFKIICGELQTETGGVELPNDCKIAKLPQEPPGGSQTPIQYVLAADTEREALLIEAEALEDSTSMAEAERIAAVHMRLAEIDAHSAPARAAVILAGLGVDEAMQNRPLGRSEEHTSELQSLMRISYAVFCLKKKIYNQQTQSRTPTS